MPTIVFIADPKLPTDLAHLGYKKGQTHELSVDQCERWVRRGVARYVSEAPAPTAAPAVVKNVAETKPAEPGAFDPATADIDVVRTYLREHNVHPGPRASEATLRRTAQEVAERS